MNLPSIGDIAIEDGKTLEVIKIFRSKNGMMLVEYTDRNGLHGCVIPEYWRKKDTKLSLLRKRLDKEKLDRQAGF